MNQVQTAIASPAVREAQDPLADNFLMPVGNTKPFFKAAFEGFAGTGKTYTMSDVVIGLHKEIGSKKPVVMFDTEQAAKYLQRPFAEAGIQLMVRNSRTLADLIKAMDMCNKGYADILIIDSISHVWEDTVEAFKKKYNRTNLQFQDWGVLKPLWKSQFANRLVHDKYHILMSGRAGYEYENEINQDTGKREIYKSGVKMKVEGETAYEPDMLVLMERFEEILGKDKKIYRQATIVKDRSGLIDGKTFKNPTYKDFHPVIFDLLQNPQSVLAEPETDSTGLFRTEEDKYQYINDKKICLEEIEGQLVKAWPSTGAADKKAKMDVLDQVFMTRSWLAVEQRGLDALKAGLAEIRQIVDAEMQTRFPDIPPVKEGEGQAATKMRAGMQKAKGKKE